MQFIIVNTNRKIREAHSLKTRNAHKLTDVGARTETRQEMVRAGARLLASKGFEATALLDVVDAAAASRGSIYFHFPEGKQQLALEALALSARQALKSAATAVQNSDSTADVVRRTSKTLSAQLSQSDYSMGCPIATVALETANSNEPIRELCAKFFDDWRSLYVGSLLRDGIEPDQAQRLATFIVATIEGGLLLSRTMGSADPLSNACLGAAELLDLLTT